MASSAERRDLAGIDLLSELPPERRAALEAACQWRRYDPQEVIIDRDSDSQEVFFVVEGRARVVNYSASGREISFDDVAAGRCFGELAAIDGAPRSATVVALTETVVAIATGDQFLETLRDSPETALSLMRYLSTIVRRSVDRIMDLSTLGANNRVQAELLRLAREAGPGDGLTGRIPELPAHADIASRVSTTRETVARVISDLTRRGLTKREGNCLQILDMDELEEMVHAFRSQ